MENLIKIKSTPLTYKLLILYALNVTDWIFTIILLNTGCFFEANIFMAYAIEKPLLGVFLKCIVPLLLVLFVNNRSSKANKKQLKIANKLINLTIIYYTVINISHIIWLSVIGIIF